MRVVLLCWCRTAHYYYDALRVAGAPPVLVVTGTRAPALARLETPCADNGVALVTVEDVHAPEALARLASALPDLILVVGWPRILRESVIGMPRVGIVNCHPSILPWYRGKEPLFWAILEGEDEIGVTLHHLTAEVDAGPILLQSTIRVPDGTTTAFVSEQVDRTGAELMPELMALASDGSLPKGRIPSEAGSSFPPVTPRDGAIDWSEPADRSARRVRACQGVTHAYTLFQGTKVVLLEAHIRAAEGDHESGTVVAVDESGITVAAGSGRVARTLACNRWLFVDREHPGTELAARLGIEPGARFGGK